MTRLMLGRTLERICKGVLLLCLLHFLIMMILYFDVYSQRFDLFSRFNNGRNGSRNNGSGTGSGHHYYYYNLSRPNATSATYLAAAEQLVPSLQPENNQTPSPKPLPPCPENPPGLVGRLLIEFSSQMTMERLQKENPNVTEGGRYKPPDCRPRWKVAIIIPFRHRENHLKYWLHYLHPILRRQKIDYGIYIINQVGRQELPYAGYFGGVSGLSKKQFLKINGFPNEYWGWGGEDDDIYNRHQCVKFLPQNLFNKIQNTKNTMKKDGISSLTYKLVQVKKYPMYTNISVEIGKPPPRPIKG
uniref:Beta-1,4-galactosyltransferase n=1 Tax=Poecilia reticulata TaxID=8081 RepID=A0A3P9PSS8_POERE